MYVSFKETIVIKFSDCEYMAGRKIFPSGSVISAVLKLQDPVILQPLVLSVHRLPQQCVLYRMLSSLQEEKRTSEKPELI